MAGLTAAIFSARSGFDTTVLERNARVGRKIAMSGNGRCNIGNVNADWSRYNGGLACRKVLEEISVEEYLRFLKSVGIFTYSDDEGRLYPVTDSASSAVDCLRLACEREGVKIVCGAGVTAVEKNVGGFAVTAGGEKYFADDAVLACGSGSQAEKPFLRGIVPDEYFSPLYPSLVPVKIQNADKRLNGIRIKTSVSLCSGGDTLATEEGEVLFREYGLSGIAIFNLSAFIAREKVKGVSRGYRFVINFAPRFSRSQLAEQISARLRSGRTADNLFYGILQNKAAEHVLGGFGKSLIPENAPELAAAVSEQSFNFDRLLDWSMSQVTCGGIKDDCLDGLKLPDGMYAIGEVLDADGLCGGYNLFFAAASAMCLFDKKTRENTYTHS